MPDVDDAAMEVMTVPPYGVMRPCGPRNTTPSPSPGGVSGVVPRWDSGRTRTPFFVGIADDEPGAFALAARNERHGAARPGPGSATDKRRHVAARVLEHRDGGKAAHHARLASDVEEAVLLADCSPADARVPRPRPQ